MQECMFILCINPSVHEFPCCFLVCTVDCMFGASWFVSHMYILPTIRSLCALV